MALPSVQGRVIAWGQNIFGQTNVPANLTNAVSIGAGPQESYAIAPGGTVTTWSSASSLPTNLVNIAYGENHRLALKTDGTLMAWGNNDYGQLDFPPGTTGVVAVAAGGNLSLALRANGQLVPWGSSSLLLSSNLANVIAIAAGGYHALVARADGTVVQGAFQNSSQVTPPPAGLSNVIAVAAGDQHSLALRADGTVTAWGRNVERQCSVPPGLSNVIALAAYGNHSLALKSDHSIVTWGDDSYGLNSPPSGLTNLVGIACGWRHSVVLQAGPRFLTTPSNIVSLFGVNVSFSASAEASTPVQFQWWRNGVALPNATNASLMVSNAQVAEAGLYTLHASADGFTNVASARLAFGAAPVLTSGITNVWVFDDESAEFQITATGPAPLQYQWLHEGVEIPGATNSALAFTPPLSGKSGAYSVRVTTAWANQITCPAYLHVLTSRRFGRVVTWGWQAEVPPDLGAVSAISANGGHTVALKLDGTVVSWGSDTLTNVPAGLREVVAVSAGAYHSLALRRDGTVTGWGGGSSGETSPPAGLDHVVGIAAGTSFSAALRDDGTVVAWGNLSCSPQIIPTDATNLVAIAAGSCHIIGLRAGGSIVAWGGISVEERSLLNSITGAVAVAGGHVNTAILLSDGSVFYSMLDPGPASGLTDAAAVAVGYQHGVLVRTNGLVLSWGADDYGQSAPPPGLSNVIAVAAGDLHSAALVETGCFIAPDVENRLAYLGSNVTLSVTVKSAHPLHYQWLHNGEAMPGATNETLPITSAQFVDGGAYVLVASNHFGLTMSPPVMLTVLPVLPSILVQPASQAGRPGSNVTVQVSAVGLAELAYQWFFNGDAIAGANSGAFTISNFAAAHAGVYSVRVANSVGSVTSSNAVLTLQPADVIIDNAQATIFGPWFNAFLGSQYGADFVYNNSGNASYFVRFSTQLPRSGSYRVHEWHPHSPASVSTALPHFITHAGGTNLVAVNQTTNGGSWNLMGTYSFATGLVASVRITAAVSEPGRAAVADAIRFEYAAVAPLIVQPPVSQTVFMGTSATFNVAVSSAAPIRLQWRKDGTNLAGATNLTLQVTNAQAADQGAYSVLVTSPDGAAFSPSASLQIVLPALAARANEGRQVIQWAGGSVLQSATNVAGPFLDVPAAFSPYTNLFDAPRRFFRLRQ